MNRDANPFFGTNQPSQVSGPDELLATPDYEREFNRVMQWLESQGVSRERMRGHISTGVMVLEQRWNKYERATEADNAALAARCETARADALEEAAKLCEAIDRKACDWIERHPDDLSPAYQHTGGVSDGADACVAAIRALASQTEGERG